MRLSPFVFLISMGLLPSAARAAESTESKEVSTPPDQDFLGRRVYLPSLLGFGMGTTPLVFGGGLVGFATYPIGIISYVGTDAVNGGAVAHSDTFSVNPNIDVRLGRVTIGGRASAAYTHTVQAGVSESSATSFELAPRVGYLAPLARHLALWPRVTLGFIVGQVSASGFPSSSVAGFLASADLLLVADLAPHLFLTAGPSGWFDTAGSSNGSSSAFGVGASIGLGVAL